MDFKRNKVFDELIIKVKENNEILKELDYHQLDLFVQYLVELNKYLEEKEDV